MTARAAGLVREGRPVSCSIPVKFAEDATGRDPDGHLVPGSSPYPLHFPLETERMANARPGTRVSTFDGLLIQPHGQLVTHLDAPCHTVLDGTLFNGVPLTEAHRNGRWVSGGVDLASSGIATRGVLLDVPRAQGRRWLDDTDAVMPADLDRAADAQGVQVRSGDCLLVRTGYRGRALYALREGADYRRPGIQAACLPWLRAADVSVLATDVPTDCFPHGYEELGFPVHTVGMWAIGLWLVDNCYLEELAERCAESGRWEFLLTVAPLVLPGGTASPVNPVAVL